jgi:hypothetical protein
VTASRMPIRYLGVAGVARWFGVQPETVSIWMLRHPGWPQPDAEIVPGRHGVPDRGWLPEREQEWREWRAAFPGRGAGGGRPRKNRNP